MSTQSTTNSTTTTTTALAISASADNVNLIVRQTPENYSRNQLSHSRCRLAGENLLDQIHTSGLSDDLDLTVARYIEKTRRTIKEMTDRRAPLTKLFDQVRREFTTLENDLDPSRPDTIPFRLQQLRNQYAAQKLQQQEAQRRADEALRLTQAARSKYLADCTDHYKAQFNNLVTTDIDRLTALNASLTTDNLPSVTAAISAFPVTLPSDWQPLAPLSLPVSLPPDEAPQISAQALHSLLPAFSAQYETEISDYRQQLLDLLPSKHTQLQRAATASAEEAQRIRQEILDREAADAARLDAARLALQQQEAEKSQALQANTEALHLFAISEAAAPAYQPKTKVTKKISVTSPAGYMQILSLWWAKEGCHLPTATLDKIFKKQISFCEKLANKDSILISDPSVQYIDDVKAQ